MDRGSTTKKPDSFLDPDAAAAIVAAATPRLETEEVALPLARSRLLATPLTARTDQPRFRKAAVDGYGVPTGQRDRPCVIVGSIAAGDDVDPEAPAGLKPGEALRIMTGAVVPPDVERIVRFEFAEDLPPDEQGRPRARDITGEKPTNIAARGENIRAGAPLLTPRRLTAMDIGILASQGYATVPVVRRPRVRVISTGTELRTPEERDIPAYAIWDSNSYQLAALAQEFSADVENYGIIPDKQSTITRTLREATAHADLVICSGGVSMGDLDLVPTGLLEIGATIRFHGLAMKPGRPTLFGTVGDTLVFGLPGNPVSTIAQFELLIAPALAAMQGLTYHPREAMLPLAARFSRSKADRHEFLPGYIRDGQIHRVSYQGSGHLSALADTQIIFRIDRGIRYVDAGERVYARWIRPEDRLSPDLSNGQV